jgi:uncharacterized protein (DUF1501 family)
MQDVALRRRIAVLVITALLAISGAALATAYFAADEQATGNSGNALNTLALRGGGDRDTLYG